MRFFVLNSGGADSTTALAMVIERFGHDAVETVSVYYGQKHRKELDCAQAIADYYDVPHSTIDLSEVYKNLKNPLTGDGDVPPEPYDAQTDGVHPVATYIPFRNGLFLSAVTAFALSRCEDNVIIVLGNHADDIAGYAYPDCGEDFVYAMTEAVMLGSGCRAKLWCPFTEYYKKDIIAEGLRLGVPYQLTWSCYNGGEKACGVCGTCRDRQKAFHANGAEDPLEYEVRL